MGLLSKFFGPASREKFAEIVRRELQRRGEVRAMRFDSAGFSLTTADGDGREVIFLGNAYSKYCGADRRDREQVVEMFVSSTLERNMKVPDSFDEACAMLMPTARSLSFFSCTSLNIRLQGASEGSILQAVELPGGIGVGLVLDFPNTVRYVPTDTLQIWGVSFEEAMEVAKDNLRAKSLEKISKLHKSLYVLPWNDTFDAARLLLPELFTRLDLNGDPVALAVHRDLVMVTGSEDVAGLALMAVTALDAVHDPYPVSARPLVLRGFEWSEFAVTKLPAPFKKLALAAAARDYADERELLAELAQRDGTGTFVAKFFPVEHTETKVLSSWVSWSNAGVQLMPEAERISFVDVGPDNKPTRSEVVPWERAFAVMGGRMQKMPEIYPPWWKVEGFPTDEEFRAMTAEETTVAV